MKEFRKEGDEKKLRYILLINQEKIIIVFIIIITI